jgi:hypothetical protein
MNLLHRYFCFKKLTYYIFALSMLTASSGQQPQVQIEAYFEPSAVTLSNSSAYKIIIQGSQNSPKGSIPNVPGLEISNNPKTFRKVSLINGVTSIKLELSFSTRPTQKGIFTIPAWPIMIDGQPQTVPAATLRVLAPTQLDIENQQKQNQQQQDLKQAAFIEFSMPREYVYEGETIVSNVGLFLWDRMPFTRIENAPVKQSEAFSATEFGQPAEKRNVIKYNKNYTSYSWKIGLTSTTSGNHSLSYHSSVRVRTNNKRSTPFNSPFFNDPFFGFGREESIKVSSENKLIEVRPLPKSGRPSQFNGAVGAFKIRSKIDRDHVSLGDPVRLTFSISGKGNFTSMPAPSFEKNKDFKIGPPAFSFQGDMQTKFEGTQNFEYVITPLTPGLLKVPTLYFSYFDPDLEKYQSISSVEHPLRVDPGEKWVDQGNTRSVGEAVPSSKRFTTQDLFQTESEPGVWQNTFISSSLLQSIAFWITQIIPLAAFCLLLFIGLKKRYRGVQSHKQQEITFLKDLKKYLSYNDSKKFFRCYRSIIQFKVGLLQSHPNPYALSSDELIELLEKANKEKDLISKVRLLLIKFDDYEFAGVDQKTLNLKEEFRQALKIIKKLK